jgi:NitT/TauT family transport system substrate-binding protein
MKKTKESAMRPALIAAAMLGAASLPVSAQPALQDIVIAMPNFTFTSTPNFIADELGLWAKHGLRAKFIQIQGIGATNAVIAGSADFVQAGGSTLTRAAARGQRLLAIANTVERNIVAITMRKELAEAGGFDASAPLAKRAQVLRGKTFGVGAINANPHAYLLVVAHQAGIRPDELRVTALEGNAMMAAFQNKQIDGMSNSPPWPLRPVVEGASVVIASGPNGDPPNAVNFAYNVVLAKPETCQKRREVCMGVGQVMKEAVAYLVAHPTVVKAILQKKFPNLDAKLIAAAFEEIRKSTPKVPVVTDESLHHADDFNIEAGMMKADAKLKSYNGLFTDEFVK